MNYSIAPTRDDLEQVYRVQDPNLAGHQHAEAVVVGTYGITVLCSANPKGKGEHTWLIRLADDGNLLWERHYASNQGTGRAMASLPGNGFVIAGDIQRSEMEYQASFMLVDDNGGMISQNAFGLRGPTGFVTVTTLNDGSILAGGSAYWKGWLMCVDHALHTRWELPLGEADDVHGIAPLADGGFAVAATEEKSTTALGMTRLAVFTSNRRVRWHKRLPAAGRGEPAALAKLPNGNIVIVGQGSTNERSAVVDRTGQCN